MKKRTSAGAQAREAFPVVVKLGVRMEHFRSTDPQASPGKLLGIHLAKLTGEERIHPSDFTLEPTDHHALREEVLRWMLRHARFDWRGGMVSGRELPRGELEKALGWWEFGNGPCGPWRGACARGEARLRAAQDRFWRRTAAAGPGPENPFARP